MKQKLQVCVVEKLDITELQKRIEEGRQCMEGSTPEAVLVIGNTGTGKSTLINILLGNELEVKKNGLTSMINPKAGQRGPKIGNTGNAETSIPTPWTNERTCITYWDCPGFEDNRSTVQDIANAFYITEIFKKSQRVKLLLSIKYGDALDPRLVSVLKMVEVIDNMFNGKIGDVLCSVSILVTQVLDRDLLAKDFSDQFAKIYHDKVESPTKLQRELSFLQFASSTKRINVAYNMSQKGDLNIAGEVDAMIGNSQFIVPSKSLSPPISVNSKSVLQQFLKNTQNSLDILSDSLYRSLNGYLDSNLMEDEFGSTRFLIRFYDIIVEVIATKDDIQNEDFKIYSKALKKLSERTQITYNAAPTLEIVRFAGNILRHEFVNILKYTHKPFEDIEEILNKHILQNSAKIEKKYKQQIDGLFTDLKHAIRETAVDGYEVELSDLAQNLEALTLIEELSPLDFAMQLEGVLGAEKINTIKQLHAQTSELNVSLEEIKKASISLSINDLRVRIFPLLLALEDKKLMFLTDKGDKKLIFESTKLSDLLNTFSAQSNDLINSKSSELSTRLDTVSGQLDKQICSKFTELSTRLDKVSEQMTTQLQTISNQVVEMKQIMDVALVPLGCIIMCPHDNDMPSFSDCDGKAISRITYVLLFNLIGIRYGGGDGINTFNLPNLMGRTFVGCNGAGSTNGIITKTGNNLGGTGGSETHTLSVAEMPSHSHNMSQSGEHYHSCSEADYNDRSSFDGPSKYKAWERKDGHSHMKTGNAGNHTHGLANTGGFLPHNNMSPFMLGRFIIRII